MSATRLFSVVLTERLVGGDHPTPLAFIFSCFAFFHFLYIFSFALTRERERDFMTLISCSFVHNWIPLPELESEWNLMFFVCYFLFFFLLIIFFLFEANLSVVCFWKWRKWHLFLQADSINFDKDSCSKENRNRRG